MSFIVLWVVLAVVGKQVLGFTVADVFVGASLPPAYITSVNGTQIGHAIAAERTGYRMTGVHFFLVLGALYIRPMNQLCPLRCISHARWAGPSEHWRGVRLFAAVALLLAPVGGLVWTLVAFAFLDNLLFFGLGSFLPLGFTDGSTLIHWWSKR
ncbi:MAG: hypothetical protein R3E39_29100 [Anaerolineae bacterium]